MQMNHVMHTQLPSLPEHGCHQAAACATTMPAKTSAGFNPLQLLDIFEKNQQICIVTRAENPTIVDYLNRYAKLLIPGCRLILNPQQSIPEQLSQQLHLPISHGRQALVEDMSQLVTLYAELLDCPRVGLRLEVTQKAMCPRFHVDKTGIRMLCTYLGHGTQWLTEDAVNREAIAHAYPTLDTFHAALLSPSAVIQQAATFAVVLLKGSAWQGNHHAGIVHRSPPAPPNAQRVLLALDALW